MEDLTFGEQVKIVLGRKGMTIKQLAGEIEAKTGKKMSRQNLTQRLGRDNFQEQDMRMIAEILECPFHLSIMSVDAQAQQRSTASLERAAAARGLTAETEERDVQAGEEGAAFSEETAPAETMPEASAAEQAAPEEMMPEAMMPEAPAAEEVLPEETMPEAAEAEETVPEMTAASVTPEPEAAALEEAAPAVMQEAEERDMTIGELYEIHEELAELEENAKAGESVEAIKKELEKPKKDLFGGLFLRRKHNETSREKEKEETEDIAAPEKQEVKPEPEKQEIKFERTEMKYREPEDFEPVIAHQDAAEDVAAGELNPYTGREYQSNSVRMHPTRIGYVQVYDRSIHKWTDMTEWAFLGLQERKKALLGNAYEPPIYLD